MIKRKFRSEFLARPVPLPAHLSANTALVITKPSADSFPRVKRIVPSSLESISDISFTRRQLIDRAYTPLLNASNKNLFTSMNRSRSTSNISTTSTHTASKQLQIRPRKSSAQEQVRIINSSKSKERGKLLIPATPELKSLSKLVNYNLYRSTPQNKRQEHYDQNRNMKATTTNPAILKVKNVTSNHNKSTASLSSATTASKTNLSPVKPRHSDSIAQIKKNNANTTRDIKTNMDIRGVRQLGFTTSREKQNISLQQLKPLQVASHRTGSVSKLEGNLSNSQSNTRNFVNNISTKASTNRQFNSSKPTSEQMKTFRK